jgi:hypothetical protein
MARAPSWCRDERSLPRQSHGASIPAARGLPKPSYEFVVL